ncbi:MAG TPA: hypothetical protein VL358_15100 [Caulobacteraceae bacterium]|nr:hypothetical protein [Caulobacteraceae bacterium]
MDAERFETLAMAYGGDLRRWPEADRDAAEAFRARTPGAAGALLRQAQALDAVLDDWRSPAPSAALRDRVLMGPPPRARKAGSMGISPRGLGFWLSGAGFAAAVLAGVVVGVTASTAAVSDARADAVLSATLANDEDAQAAFTVGSAGARAG